MIKIFLLSILISLNLYGFRVSRLLSDGVDALPKSLSRWKNKDVSIGYGIETNGSYPTSATTCSNISNAENLIKEIISQINGIPDANINLTWGGTAGDYNITIYSYTSTEWDTFKTAANITSSVLGRTETSASCATTEECNFTSNVIRLNCVQLDYPPLTTTSDFYSVVIHEIIHAIGLDHSGTQDAVMYPSVIANTTSKRVLTNDEESGIIFLYPKTSGPSFLKYFVCGRVSGHYKYTLLEKIKNLIWLLVACLYILLIRYKRLNQPLKN